MAARAGRWGVTTHKVTVGETGVAQAKSGKCCFPTPIPVGGERPWKYCGFNGVEFVLGLLVPRRLPYITEERGEGWEAVGGRDGKLGVAGSQGGTTGKRVGTLIARDADVSWDPAEGDVFLAGGKAEKPFLNSGADRV